MMSNAIKIHGVRKSFGTVQALQRIDLEIRVGEFFGLLGPNGAGKTTLISAITGLVRPDTGTITVMGYDIHQNPLEAKRLLALSPQEVNINTFMPIEKIMEYQGGFYGLSKKESVARSEQLLKQFGIWEKRKSGRFVLSGGMQRRLMIARALMGNPKILILDEPTAGVDVELRHDLWEYLKKINNKGLASPPPPAKPVEPPPLAASRLGTTILLTTHYIEEAEMLCDRVGIIHEGKIVALDTPANLIQQNTAKEPTHKGKFKFVRSKTLEEVFVHLTGRGIMEEHT